MTGPERPAVSDGVTCDDVAELAGLYVLGALDNADREVVRSHLASCREAHSALRELGGVVPALAALAEPVDAPAELKARVMTAVAREAAPAKTSLAQPLPVAVERPTPERSRGAIDRQGVPGAPAAWRLPTLVSWGAAVAAVLVLAVAGVWTLGLQARVDQANRRDAVLSDAIAAFSAPGSSVAVLRPTGTAPGAGSGFAAVSADGRGYLVMVGLPAAPAGQTYQAWYIADDRPTSAGLLIVDADGYALLHDDEVLAGTDVVALTLEPAGGSDEPSTEPFAVGELRPV